MSVGTVFCAVTTGKRQPWPIRPSAAAFSIDLPEENEDNHLARRPGRLSVRGVA
jgi:hypothetical protein